MGYSLNGMVTFVPYLNLTIVSLSYIMEFIRLSTFKQTMSLVYELVYGKTYLFDY